ncbi:MAG: spermine/spermidine synthase domain-containing protein [Candidatus Methylomirabilia bacterium]
MLADRDTKTILLAVAATGVSSVVTQLLLIREFLAAFHGNEFVIALILSTWLLLGGTGAWLARVAADRRPAGAGGLGRLSLALVGVTPVMFLSIRGLRDVFFIHGTSVGFYPTLAFTVGTLAPYCLLVGFLLPYSLFVLRAGHQGYPGAFVYMTDNLGDVAGGALFSFALVQLVTPLQAVFVANLPLLALGWHLAGPGRRCKPANLLAAFAALGLLVAGVLGEWQSLTASEAQLVHYQESRHGRITVFRNREQYTLFSNGTPALSTQNQGFAEEIVHFPLSQLDRAGSILLISAAGGMLDEVGKYQPSRVDYVELDPAMSDVQFSYGLLGRIPGLEVINEDGRRWIGSTKRTYDAIIVNLQEPETFQANRFFTERFFALAKSRLNPGGILSFSMAGFDSYLAEPQRRKLSILRATVARHFRDVLLLPGQSTVFLCRDQPLDPDIPARLRTKGIAADFIGAYYEGDVTPERIEQLNGLLVEGAPTNQDESPRLMRVMFSQWFAKFATSPLWFAAVLCVLTALYLSRLRRAEFVLFTTGATAMGAEVLVIFAFQIYFGYIYLEIGLIVTVFLAGLLPGAWLGQRLSGRGRRVLMVTDLLLILLLAAFVLILHQGGDRLPVAFYLVFGFAVSLACGCQFPAVLRLGGGDNPAAARAFSADLIGAACGTLATSVVLIPWLGLFAATLCLIGLKSSSLALMAATRET